MSGKCVLQGRFPWMSFIASPKHVLNFKSSFQTLCSSCFTMVFIPIYGHDANLSVATASTFFRLDGFRQVQPPTLLAILLAWYWFASKRMWHFYNISGQTVSQQRDKPQANLNVGGSDSCQLYALKWVSCVFFIISIF